MPGFTGKTGQIQTVAVFRSVKPDAKVRVLLELDPEPTCDLGTVASTFHERTQTNLNNMRHACYVVSYCKPYDN